MLNDKTTLRDLAVYTAEGDSVFNLIDHTTTQYGKEILRKHIQHPPGSYEQLAEMQEVIRYWMHHPEQWPTVISNGTLVMLDKFFEAADGATPPGKFNLITGSWFLKLFNRNEYFFTQFSVSHLADFLKGCLQLTELLQQENLPAMLRRELETMQEELGHRLTQEVAKVNKDTPYKELSSISYRARREMKHMVNRLMLHYARLDAWQSMAQATKLNSWIFPELLPANPLHFRAEGLYHPLIQHPVAYEIDFSNRRNLLILTGANMSGKTTFMRSLGVGALLAHLGMGVPAKSMNISFLQGIITNMHVEDNILKGESYFFAEVKRMKHTAEKLVQPEPHLVLMDELFKGTNVHDAYECTRAVVEGLLQRPNHLMVLSTHLYEVAQYFSSREDILFAYFVTSMGDDGSYKFSYELKPGISNDRIGYRILQKEGVLDLLNRKSGE
ncbi:MutS-related protein [Chitinophagaceae bacterium MMS25-I14]